jgi:hypothetical protein
MKGRSKVQKKRKEIPLCIPHLEKTREEWPLLTFETEQLGTQRVQMKVLLVGS